MAAAWLRRDNRGVLVYEPTTAAAEADHDDSEGAQR